MNIFDSSSWKRPFPKASCRLCSRYSRKIMGVMAVTTFIFSICFSETLLAEDPVNETTATMPSTMPVDVTPATATVTSMPVPMKERMIVQVNSDSAELDLAAVPALSEHEIVFVLTNTLDRPLRIRRGISSCKCFLPKKLPDIVPAGEKLDISLTYSAPAERGEHSNRFVLLTDDPKRKIVTLTVKSEVDLPLAMTETSIDLGQVAPGETLNREVYIINRGQKPISLLKATSPSKHLSISIPKNAVPPGEKRSLPITCQPENALGKHEATIHLETDYPNQPQVEFNVQYEIKATRETSQTSATPIHQLTHP